MYVDVEMACGKIRDNKGRALGLFCKFLIQAMAKTSDTLHVGFKALG